jgi:hypothetical protein
MCTTEIRHALVICSIGWLYYIAYPSICLLLHFGPIILLHFINLQRSLQMVGQFRQSGPRHLPLQFRQGHSHQWDEATKLNIYGRLIEWFERWPGHAE